MDYPGFFALDRMVRDVQQQRKVNVPMSWQRRPMFLGLFQLAEMMNERPLQIDRFPVSPLWASYVLEKYKQRPLKLFGQHYPSPLAFFPWHMLNRIIYKQVMFPSSAQWDIYHSPYYPLPPHHWTGNAVRLLTVHDCINLKYPHLSPEIPAAVGKSLRSVDPSTDYVICDSEYTRQDVLTFIPIAPERTRVIPLAASDLFKRPNKDLAYSLLQTEGVAPEKYVLGLGQLYPRKNLLNLARAFLHGYRQGDLKDYVLLFVTSRGANRTSLFKQLYALGLPESAVRVVYNIDDETLAALYACAGLFAYVSFYEGFGIPPLEAMSAGCPVVVSQASSLPEVVGDAGEYVDPHDIESIAAGLARVLHNADLRAALIDKGHQQAARFSWHNTSSMNLEFYREVYEKHRGL
jgi:glycosyltransferase involved in cell wall biosynthesis